MSTNGCTLEVVDKKEVLIELDFYNITLNSKASFILDVTNILYGIPERVKKLHEQRLWLYTYEYHEEDNNFDDESD